MFRVGFMLLCVISVICLTCTSPLADQRGDAREQAISDALDLWRDGRYEQLYDSLSRRNGMTRERFVNVLKESSYRPACCFTKLQNFRLIADKRTTAKVFARIGLDGSPGSESSHSREFILDHEENRWKMRMNDVKALAGKSGNKSKKK